MTVGSNSPKHDYMNIQDLLQDNTLPSIQTSLSLDQVHSLDSLTTSEYFSPSEISAFTYQGYSYQLPVEYTNPNEILPPRPPVLPSTRRQETGSHSQRRSSVDSGRIANRSNNIPIPLIRRSSVDSNFVAQESPSSVCSSQSTTPTRKKRAQVKRACVHCRKVSKKCSESRPCDRCVSKGLTCYDVTRKGKTFIEPTQPKQEEYSQSWRSDTSLDHHMNALGLESQTDPNELYRVDHSYDIDPYRLEQYPQELFERYDGYTDYEGYGYYHNNPALPIDPEEQYREEMMMSSICHYSDDDFPRPQDSFTC